jgi:hypothetical protein
MPTLEVTQTERESYPTYDTAARVVEGNDLTSPFEFLAWTTVRAMLIAPGIAMAGVRGKKLIFGSLFGSMFVSTAALWRSYATKQREVWEENRQRRAAFRQSRGRRRLPSRMRRR